MCAFDERSSRRKKWVFSTYVKMASVPLTGEVMFLTVKQVAERLQVSTGTIYGAVDRGELKAHRFGRSTALRISEESLSEYIEGCAEDDEKPTQGYRHLKL